MKSDEPRHISRRNFIGFALAGAGSLATSGLVGCTATSQPVISTAATTRETQEWKFTDQTDNEVTVNIPVSRMVVLQHHSLDMLAQLGARDKVVGIDKKWESDLGAYMRDVFLGIDGLPTPGDLTNWNVEQISALKPDVVIAASQANADAIKQVRDLGIPVVVVSLRGEGKQTEAQNPRLSDADAAYTNKCEWAIKMLGKLTGKEQRAQDIWDFCMDSRGLVDKALGTISDDQRVRVFVACPDDKTYGNDKYVGCQLLRAGAINMAANDIQGYKTYTLEMLAKWDPDVIIVQDRYPEVFNAITTDAKYAELSAVKNNKVLLSPYLGKAMG